MDVLKMLQKAGLPANQRPSVAEQKRIRDEMWAKRSEEKMQVTYLGSCTDMMKEQFRVMLRNFDWSYEYSDDHRVWKRGSDAKARIDRLAGMYPELAEILRNHRGGRGL